MISKDGTGYWSTAITVWWDNHNGGWCAEAEYLDDGWVGDDNADTNAVSTQGRLYTRYAVRAGDTVSGLTAAVEAIVRDAQWLGITFTCPGDGAAYLTYKGDGEWSDYPPPDGWRELLQVEAERIGFRFYGTQAATR